MLEMKNGRARVNMGGLTFEIEGVVTYREGSMEEVEIEHCIETETGREADLASLKALKILAEDALRKELIHA